MTRLIAAELIKLRTVRSTWAALLVLPLVAFISLLDAALDPVEHNTSIADFMDVSLTVVALTIAAFAATQVGGEFRRGTIGLDFLAVPSRTPALSAKMAAHAMVGALIGTVAVFVAHAVVMPVALGRDVAADGLGTMAGRVLVLAGASALLGALGAALGVLMPYPALAVGVIIGWQFVESVLGLALGIGDYLPIGLLNTLAHLGDTLALPAGMLLLSAYIATAAAAAITVGRRRDLA